MCIKRSDNHSVEILSFTLKVLARRIKIGTKLFMTAYIDNLTSPNFP